MLVENKVQDVDGRMLMYHESVKKLGQHLEVLEQLHTAPSMYLSAVAEVVRRRAFSQAFLSVRVFFSNLKYLLNTLFLLIIL